MVRKASEFLAAIAASLYEPNASKERSRAHLARLDSQKINSAGRSVRTSEATRGDLRACPELAYRLHLTGLCRRRGGKRVCADCLADLRPEEAARFTVRESA